MEHKEWYRSSANGQGKVYSQMFICDNPKAIIQIAHGMSERSERYQDFMMFLARNSYIVCANDHLGHGLSNNGEFGVFAKKLGGFDFMIQDIDNLFENVRLSYPNLPMILIGQSMGSILSALFADRYDYLDKLILMGTPQYNKFIDFIASKLSKSVEKHGFTYKSKLWNKIIWGKQYDNRNKKIKSLSWLTNNNQVIEQFIDDDLCGHMFSDSANLEMMCGLKKWGNGNWGSNIKDIPILFIAGTKDKIAGYGKGTKYYYNLLADTHSKLTLKLLDGNHHEILNDLNKLDNYQYLLNWLNK